MSESDVKTPRVVTLEEKLDVSYVIPLWLRDEQIRLSCERPIGRLQPAPRREEQIAVVGFGPSLQDTWEQIRAFPFVISCSGAHRFLIDRGIIPNWHVEVDPRSHKIGLMGAPHPSVEYLVASTCSPAYFDHLADSNVKLWHIFDGSEDGVRMLPPGEWAVTGGCDAGLRAMTMAAFLGFRDLHIFGLDGSARGDSRHAGEHPYGKQKFVEITHNGKVFYTTPAMLAASKGTVHELEQMPAVKATFYGEGLTQELARGYVPAKAEPTDKPFANVIGLFKPPVITPDYVKLNAQLHKENLAYGVGGAKHADVVRKLAKNAKSVLDYGCGKGKLAAALDFPIWEYDPAIPGKDGSPRPAELVVCTDVLEHIEPELLQGVLMDLRRVTKSIGYFVIHTGAAQKTLADGRNAHLIQHGEEWWRKNLATYFRVAQIIKKGPELHVIVASNVHKGKKSV